MAVMTWQVAICVGVRQGGRTYGMGARAHTRSSMNTLGMGRGVCATHGPNQFHPCLPKPQQLILAYRLASWLRLVGTSTRTGYTRYGIDKTGQEKQHRV
jgi:hypothetical protein